MFHKALLVVAAATLGVPYESIRIAGPLDTQYSPYEWQTVASRLTWSMGNAVQAAAGDARRQILETVADAWDEDVERHVGTPLLFGSHLSVPQRPVVGRE